MRNFYQYREGALLAAVQAGDVASPEALVLALREAVTSDSVCEEIVRIVSAPAWKSVAKRNDAFAARSVWGPHAGQLQGKQQKFGRGLERAPEA